MTAVFAHRGFTGEPGDARRPRENTLEAYEAARLAGADGVELDVRMTADGKLAVHHDAAVPGGRPIATIPAAELPAYVPLLEAAIGACQPMAVNVEIKHEPGSDPDRRLAVAVAELVAELLARRAAGATGGGAGGSRGAGGAGGAGGARGAARVGGVRPQAVLVSSFDPESIRAARAADPDLAAGLLADWRTPAAAAVEEAVALGCATLHPFVAQVDGGLVEAARAAGLGLHVWTVNADGDILAMAGLGVEAVITDRAAAAVALLGGRAGGGARARR